MREAIAEVTLAEADELARDVFALPTAAEIEHCLLDRFAERLDID
ncbi:MAG: hypothetical protein QM756_10945 [Polyangiaceae bacterium]